MRVSQGRSPSRFEFGCGGSMNFNSSGTPAGTFTLTITGTYTAAPRSSPATLTNTTNLTMKVN